MREGDSKLVYLPRKATLSEYLYLVCALIIARCSLIYYRCDMLRQSAQTYHKDQAAGYPKEVVTSLGG